MNAKKNYDITGITQQEALSHLEKYGHNELRSDSSRGIIRIIFSAIKEPMVLLLIGIGVIYLVLGEAQEVYSLLTFLILILGITIYQENKTEKTLLALKELSSPRAIVIREGKQIRIPGREVVPDDIVILNEGDRIPADIELSQGGPLSVDESIISGESFPVEKSTSNIVLSGTLVLRGQALGKVIKTGQQTELGQIGKSLEEKDEKGTPLQKNTRRIVNKLSILVSIITIFIIVYFWFTRHELIEGILIGLTLAMAILPNELPAVLLIFLAAGAWRISKRNVLTRKVPSIEALGGITYLCVDKTGTLTQNKMILKTLWNGKESLEIKHINQTLPESFHEIMEYGILASPQDPFDPMEKSLRKVGDELLDKTEHLHPDWELSREYQISNELLAVSYAWKGEEKKGYIIGAKGATEAIIDLCHLPPDSANMIEQEMLQMASEGVRVIAVAKAFSKTLPENQHDLNFEFLGLVGFEDPIRGDARASIQECQEAGIKVLMITGDHPATAESIAKQISLSNPERTLTGNEVQNMDDRSLLDELRKVQVFCRMKPLDKLRLVSLLQSYGEVVAMTGDGVNDAPALKKAQIGIAMGKRGTDVAREASSVVLLDDSFSSIVAAIKIGRRIFQNLQEAFSYLLAIHIPITFLSVVPVLFNLPLILLPVHIAFLHLIIEPASTTLFEALPSEPDLMKQKPRPKNLQLISKQEIFRSLATGTIISIAVIGVFSFSLYRGLDASEARGITFTTLIISNLFLIYILRGKRKAKENQNHLKLLTLATFGLLSIVLYVPFFRDLFRFEFLHFHDLLPSLLVSLISAGGTKLIYRRSKVMS
jgi:Ca2+-transporting ATPase